MNGVSIAEHKDFYDGNQTFYVPSMVISAYDINTRTNIAKNDTKSTIIDEVQLSGLKEDKIKCCCMEEERRFCMELL